MDDVRRDVHRAVENYIKILMTEGIGDKTLKFEELAAELQDKVKVFIGLRPATRIIHMEDSLVEDLTAKHAITLQQNEQVIIGSIDTSTAVFCKVNVKLELVEGTDVAAETLDAMANEVSDFIKGLGPGKSITENELKAMLISDARVRDAAIDIKMYLPASSDSEEDITDDRMRAGIWHINPSEYADTGPYWPKVY
jgi:hypothetical protein